MDRHDKKKRKKKEWVLLWMILPFVILTLVFHYIPLMGWSYAFIDYRLGKSPFQSRFVGLDNFTWMFSKISRMPRALRNTLIPNLIGLCISWTPIAFAILLNELRSPRMRKIVQTFTTIPNFISLVMVYGILIGFIGSDGMINVALKRWGVIKQSINLFNNVNIAWTVEKIIGQWKGLGFSAIIYLAALGGIDQELYGAASVDGAGRFRQIWHITIPGLMPTYLVQLLLGIGSFFSSGMDYALIFGNALTNSKLENLAYYSYGLFKSADYSKGIALGVMQSVVAIILLTVANILAKKVRGESIV